MEKTKNKITPSDSAKEAVLVANTSSFVFKRLRDDTMVRYIADTYTAKEISDWIVAHAAEFSVDPMKMVLGYMYLVALSMKDGSEVAPLLRSLPLATLEWGTEIASSIVARSISTNFLRPSLAVEKLRPTLPPVGIDIIMPSNNSLRIRSVS